MPHEEAIIVSPLDEKMEQELVKANVTDAVISALKEKYGNLRLRSVDDKETYLEIKDAKKDCAKLRNLAIKVCKEGREQAVAIQKKWVAKQNEVVAHIEQVESPLDDEINRFDAEVSRKEQEEKQRQETMYMQRTQALTKIGALYHDNGFMLGETFIESNLVKESSDDTWYSDILPKFEEEYRKVEAERIELERIAAQKKEQERKERDEFERQQLDFRRQQEEFRQKQQAEERQRLEEQNKIQQDRYAKIVQYSHVGEYVDLSKLWVLTQPVFDEILAAKKKSFEEWEVQRQKQIEEAAAQRERKRIEEENILAEIKRKQEEARKAEELAKAGDKALWTDFIQKLDKISVPVLKSGQYRKVGNIAKEKIEEILALKPY